MGYRTTKSKIKAGSNKANNYTDFFYYTFRNILITSIPLVIISAIILSSLHSSATNSGSDSVTLPLSTSCTLSSSVITPHNASLNGGQYEEGIGDTRINTYCNDNNGYSIYAIGTSNNVDGNTDLVSDIDEHYNIHTGAYVNGNNINTSTPSFWGMKLTPGVGTGSVSELTPPTIMNSYNSYNVVPTNYTLVASRTSGTNMTIDTDITGSYFNTTYNIYASSVQPAGSYEGRVKYVMLHPHNNNNNIAIETAFALNGKERHGLYYAMQDMTTEICNAANVYDETSQTQLVDTRDNKLYWVAKLQDGHCWMTQNLDLDLETTPTNVAPLTSENTDLNDKSLSGAYTDGYTYDTTTDTISWKPSSNTIKFSGTAIGTGCTSTTAACSADKTDDTGIGHSSLGNYYSYTAAIASNNSSSLTKDNDDAGNSICPKGWHLPSKTNNEFNILNNLYNSGSNSSDAGLVSSPLWFVKGGHIYSSFLDYLASGEYRSSTVQNGTFSYTLFFNSNKAVFSSNYGRGDGRSARCLAR